MTQPDHVAAVLSAVHLETQIPPSTLTSGSRNGRYHRARLAAYLILHRDHCMTDTEIGELFNRDRSTINHAISNAFTEWRDNPHFKELVHRIRGNVGMANKPAPETILDGIRWVEMAIQACKGLTLEELQGMIDSRSKEADYEH